MTPSNSSVSAFGPLEDSQDSASVVIIPEFQNIGLLMIGILGLVFIGRRKSKEEER